MCLVYLLLLTLTYLVYKNVSIPEVLSSTHYCCRSVKQAHLVHWLPFNVVLEVYAQLSFSHQKRINWREILCYWHSQSRTLLNDSLTPFIFTQPSGQRFTTSRHHGRSRGNEGDTNLELTLYPPFLYLDFGVIMLRDIP